MPNTVSRDTYRTLLPLAARTRYRYQPRRCFTCHQSHQDARWTRQDVFQAVLAAAAILGMWAILWVGVVS